MGSGASKKKAAAKYEAPVDTQVDEPLVEPASAPGKEDMEPDSPTLLAPLQPSKQIIRGLSEGMLIVEKTHSIADIYAVGNKTSLLAEGRFGKVRLAVNKQTGRDRVVKSIRRKKVDRKWLMEMVHIVQILDHPNVVKLHEMFEDRMDFHLVMDYCEGGHLFQGIDELENFSEKQIGGVMRQIFRAVAYMHKSSICYRGICPENLMLSTLTDIDNWVVRLVDFSTACSFTAGVRMDDFVGSPECMSPQVVNRDYDQSCDLWSCAVIMYAILADEMPFRGDTDDEILDQVQQGLIVQDNEQWDSGVSQEAKDLIVQLFALDEASRGTPEAALAHAWTSSHAPSAATACLKANQLQNMRNFAQQNQLKKAALHMVAKRLDNEEIEDLKLTFMALDVNNDGTITMKELKTGIQKLDKQTSSVNLRELMDAMDVNGSREVDYTEFLAAALDEKHYEEEGICWTAFRHFDRDGNGVIDRQELQQVLHDEALQEAFEQAEIDRIMKDCDGSGDGSIDFDEFMCMMRGTTYEPLVPEKKLSRHLGSYRSNSSLGPNGAAA